MLGEQPAPPRFDFLQANEIAGAIYGAEVSALMPPEAAAERDRSLAAANPLPRGAVPVQHRGGA